MEKERIGQLELVRLVKRLSVHRAIDVERFASDLERTLRTGGFGINKLDTIAALLSGLDEELTDLDCAIVDVLLAESLEEARSIVDGFNPTER